MAGSIAWGLRLKAAIFRRRAYNGFFFESSDGYMPLFWYEKKYAHDFAAYERNHEGV